MLEEHPERIEGRPHMGATLERSAFPRCAGSSAFREGSAESSCRKGRERRRVARYFFFFLATTFLATVFLAALAFFFAGIEIPPRDWGG
jgi:hypothetical protein